MTSPLLTRTAATLSVPSGDIGLKTLREFLREQNPDEKHHPAEVYNMTLESMNQDYSQNLIGRLKNREQDLTCYKHTGGYTIYDGTELVGVSNGVTLYIKHPLTKLPTRYFDRRDGLTDVELGTPKQVKYPTEYLSTVFDPSKNSSKRYPVLLQTWGEYQLRATADPKTSERTADLALIHKGMIVAVAQDEWGATLISVAEEYRGHGLGVKIRKYWGALYPAKRSGGYTHAGERMARKVWSDRVHELASHGVYSDMVAKGVMTKQQVQAILADAQAPSSPESPTAPKTLGSGEMLVYSDGTMFVLYDSSFLESQDDQFVKGFGFLRESRVGTYFYTLDYSPQYRKFATGIALQLAKNYGSPLYVGEGYGDLIEDTDWPVSRDGDYLELTKDIMNLKVLASQEKAARKRVDPHGEIEHLLLGEAHSKDWGKASSKPLPKRRSYQKRANVEYPPSHMPQRRVSPRRPKPLLVKYDAEGNPKPSRGFREDPMTEERLQPGLAEFKKSPSLLNKAVQKAKKYPNFRNIKVMTHRAAEQIIDQMADNLVWLFNEWRQHHERSKQWYAGGNALVSRWATQYGFDPHQIAGVLAVFSPEMPWFSNVTLAQRFLMAYTSKRDVPWDERMSRVFLGLSPRTQANVNLQDLEGKTINELLTSDATLYSASMWIRCWDLAYNVRSCYVLTPEGKFDKSKIWTTETGKPETANLWKYMSCPIKSIRILQDGSLQNISDNLGEAHKVRSFYNNLIAPFDKTDVTIDTHAVAAALLRPLGTSDLEVLHNFGGMGDVSGLKGMYGLYAEAYRRAAGRVGTLPREMQSICWEAVRALFNSRNKQYLKGPANAIWLAHTKGDIDVDTARQQIKELAGGFGDPDWLGSNPPDNEGEEDTSFPAKLSFADGPGGRPGAVPRPRGRGGLT